MDDKGRVLKGLYIRQGGRRVLPRLGGFIGPAAAYLADTAFDGNPFFGSEELRQLALDAGDRLVMDCGDITPQTKPNHFQSYPMARLIEGCRDYAGRGRLARWRGALSRNLKATLAIINRTWENLGKPAPWSGTGPNHYFGWFAVAYQQAMVLGEDAALTKIARAMQRHMKIQSAGGYFPEHIGPAIIYHQVSLGGLAEFHRLRPGPGTLAAVQRGADFAVHAIYPDLRGIETFDERNRLYGSISLQPGLFWTPAARALAARIVAAHRSAAAKVSGPPTSERSWYELGEWFRCWEHSEATRRIPIARRLPMDGENFAWRMEEKGLVRKRGPWFYAMSAWAHPHEMGNPYHLERTQALSIYHSAAGLVVGGGNDRHAYRAATIHIVEGGNCVYFPAMAGALRVGIGPKVLSGRGACDRLEFDYGSVRANLEVRADGPKRLRIALGVWTSQTRPEIWLTLQLPHEIARSLWSDGRKLNLPKARDGQSPTAHPVGRVLSSVAGWMMTLPAGSKLLWPHIPWNSYRPPTYADEPEHAVALVKIPLHGQNWRVEVAIAIK